MSREPQIQLPKKFLTQTMVLLYSLGKIEGLKLDEMGEEAIKYLQEEIEAKIERKKLREAFTEYKTAPIGEEREKKRLEYLEKSGIQQDWISNTEIHS